VLGVLPNSRYESAKISLRQRDVIVLYTDGAAKLRIQQDNNTPPRRFMRPLSNFGKRLH
jgi:hypothetical protein